jgi:hypothetical protein
VGSNDSDFPFAVVGVDGDLVHDPVGDEVGLTSDQAQHHGAARAAAIERRRVDA